jgi:hypothetical protein
MRIPKKTKPLPHEVREMNKSKGRKLWEKIRDFFIWLFTAIVAGISALLGF